MKKIIKLLFGLIPVFAVAQNPILELQKYEIQYKGQKDVLTNVSSVLEFLVNDTGKLEIVETKTEERFYIMENLNRTAGTRIYYSGSFNEVYDIEVYVYTPEGSKYKKTSITQFEHEEEISDDYFQDDSKFVQIAFGEIKKGSKTFVKYKMRYKDPHLLSGFTFHRWSPVDMANYTIKFNSKVKLNIVEKNFQNLITKNTSTEKSKKYGNLTVYNWSAKSLPELKEEDDAPSSKYYAAHVIPILTSYEGKKETVQVLGSVENLHNWYAGLLPTAKQNYSEELKKITDSLVQGADTDIEKVKQIYYWVHTNIKYIAFEAGMEGFVPRLAKDVCKKRFGDCKDMANIMCQMMSIANIKGGHHVWVGTRAIPYTYAEVPSSAADNHMIAAYTFGDSIIYLDGTASFTPFGMPSSGVQGKEALIHIDSTNFMVKTIPVVNESQSVYKDSIRLELTGTKLFGTGILSCTGYNGYLQRNYLNSVPKASYESWIKQLLSKGSNKFILDTFIVENKLNADKDLLFNYRFKLDNYVKLSGSEMYLNLSLDKPLQSFEIKKNRQNMYEQDFKTTQVFITEFVIPEGYAVDYLPENLSVNKGMVSIEFKYTQQGNILKMHQTIKRKSLLIAQTDFEEYNKLMKQLTKQYNETVVLKKKL